MAKYKGNSVAYEQVFYMTISPFLHAVALPPACRELTGGSAESALVSRNCDLTPFNQPQEII